MWEKIFSHDVTGGVFKDVEDVKNKNENDENAKLFSILDKLENCRNPATKKFHFKLCYPDLNSKCNEWLQASNPVTEERIEGFNPIKLDFPTDTLSNPFVGLGLSPVNFDQTLIDANPENQFYWFSIGAMEELATGKIPGPSAVSKVEFFVKPF